MTGLFYATAEKDRQEVRDERIVDTIIKNLLN